MNKGRLEAFTSLVSTGRTNRLAGDVGELFLHAGCVNVSIRH